MGRGQKIHNLSLYYIRILIFIDKDMRKLPGISLQYLGMIHKKLSRIDEKIIKIHDVQCFFAYLILRRHRPYIVKAIAEIRVPYSNDIFNGCFRVKRKTDDIPENIPFGKFHAFGIDAYLGDACIDELR